MRSLSVFRREKVNPTTCNGNGNGNSRDVHLKGRVNNNKGERIEDTRDKFASDNSVDRVIRLLNEHGDSDNTLHFQKVFENATWNHQNIETGTDGDNEHGLGDRVLSEIELRGKCKNADSRHYNHHNDNHDQKHQEGHHDKSDEATAATSSISFNRSGSARESGGIAVATDHDNNDRPTATNLWSRSRSTRGRSRAPDGREVMLDRDRPSLEKQLQLPRGQSLKITERSRSCRASLKDDNDDDPKKRASSLEYHHRSSRSPHRQQLLREKQQRQQQQQHRQRRRSQKNCTTLQRIPQQRRSSSAPRKITHAATTKQVHRNSLAGNDSVSTLQGGERGQSYRWDPAQDQDAAVPTTIRTTALTHGDDEQPPEVKVTHCGIYSSSRREAIRSESRKRFDIETEIHCKSSKHAKQQEEQPQRQNQLVLRKPSASKHELVHKPIVNTTTDKSGSNKNNKMICAICRKTPNPGQFIRFSDLCFCAAIRGNPGSSSCFKCAVCQRPLDGLLDPTGGSNTSIGRGNDRGGGNNGIEFLKRTKVVSNPRGSVVLCGKCAVGTTHSLTSHGGLHAGDSGVDGGSRSTRTAEDDGRQESTAPSTTATTSVPEDIIDDDDTKCQYFSTDDECIDHFDEDDDKFANIIILRNKFDPLANDRCKSHKSTASDTTPKIANRNKNQQREDLHRYQRKNHRQHRVRSLQLLRENANLKQKNKDLSNAIAEILSQSNETKNKEAKYVQRIESLEGQLKHVTDSLANAKKENAVLNSILETVHGAAAASSSKLLD